MNAPSRARAETEVSGRPSFLAPAWVAQGLAVIAKLEASGHSAAVRCIATLGRERATEMFLAGAWLKSRLCSVGFPASRAANAAWVHGKRVAAGEEPWACAFALLAELAPPAGVA